MHQLNEEESQQFIPFFDAHPAPRTRTSELPVVTGKGEVRRVNMFGDTYKRNNEGQVTYFKYAGAHVSYTFNYDECGEITALCGSNGWFWTRSDSGWAVSNCFDKWLVDTADCESVEVGENGIEAKGAHPELMGLPERR